jgi:SAM-dependent methyltransferase
VIGGPPERMTEPQPNVESIAAELGLALRYDLNDAGLAGLTESVVRLRPDAGTLAYLQGAPRARHGRVLTWIHHALRGLLSDFDINGYLGTYPLFVLSTRQWQELLPKQDGRGTLLDIGAGRGDVTAELARLFGQVTVAETSRGMARRLGRQGYRVLEVDLGETDIEGTFDAVSLLNVLDRCDRPLSLLARARQLLRPGGVLIIALVLPYRPFVYRGRVSRAPRERLPINARTFEAAARELISLVLLPLGLRLRTISRAPYLSGGDSSRALYELDDLIVVAEAIGPPPPILGKRPH